MSTRVCPCPGMPRFMCLPYVTSQTVCFLQTEGLWHPLSSQSIVLFSQQRYL